MIDNLNALKKKLGTFKENYKDECGKMNDLEEELSEKRRENDIIEDEVQYLTQEYNLKLKIYEECIRKLEDFTSKQVDKDSTKFTEKSQVVLIKDDIKNLKKLTEVYTDSKPETLVEELIKDNELVTSDIIKQLESNKKTQSDNLISVSVKYSENVVSFRIIDEYYTFSDLLFESCSNFNLEAGFNYRIVFSTGDKLDLSASVKEKYMQFKQEGRAPPDVMLKSLKHDIDVNVEHIVPIVQNKADSQKNDQDIIKLFDGNEMDIEDELLKRIKNIIFYLVFLFIVYVSNMSKNKIHETYYMNHAFYNQVVTKSYYANNNKGLENSFESITSNMDFYNWYNHAFSDIFDFSDVIYIRNDFNENKTYTTFMESFIVVGAIRIVHTRHQNTNSTVYEYSSNLHTEAFKHLDGFRKESQLKDTFSYDGALDHYRYDKAYTVLLPPKSRDVLLFISMLNNIKITSQMNELFVISFTGYNYNQDVLLSCNLYFENSYAGEAHVNYNTCSINFMGVIYKYYTWSITSNIIELISNTIIVFYSISGLYNIIRGIIEDKKKFFRNFWNYIKFFKIVLFVTCLVLRITIYLSVGNKMRWVDENTFLDNYDVCELYQILNILEMLTICTALIYFLCYLDENIVLIFYNTLEKSYVNIFVFICSFLFSLIGFALFCHYIYGVNISEFRNLDKAIIQVFLMVFGSFYILPSMYEVLDTITLIFSFFFGLTFFLLYTNWLIGTIIYYYSYLTKKEEEKLVPTFNLKERLNLFYTKLFRSILLIVRLLSNRAKKIKNKFKQKQKDQMLSSDRSDEQQKIIDKRD